MHYILTYTLPMTKKHAKVVTYCEGPPFIKTHNQSKTSPLHSQKTHAH